MAEAKYNEPSSMLSSENADARSAFNAIFNPGQDKPADHAEEKVFFYFWDRSSDFRTLLKLQHKVFQDTWPFPQLHLC